MTVVGQSEVDAYASRVLAKHWPSVPNLGDITKITEADLERLGPIDLVCGGFPCQDLSVAGKQGGIKASRSGLFWELMRVVRLVRPRFVLLENVPALLSRSDWMGAVLGELASCGFDAQWDCIPAQAVGAPHRRDRIFIVATLRHADGQSESTVAVNDEASRMPGDLMAYADGRRHGTTEGAILSRWTRPELRRRWIPEPGMGRVADGVPARVDRLRGLGNAVVPQVAEHVGRIIMALAEESRPEQRQAQAQPEADATLDARR